MRVPNMPRVCSAIVAGCLVLLSGCGQPSSINLQSLSITATPSTVSVGGSVVLHATAHLSDGSTQDVTSGTQWSLSDTRLATIANGVVTSKAAGSLSLQGVYVEVAPVPSSGSNAAAGSQTLSSSAQVTITPADTTTTTPVITWSTPAAIAFGTALSSVQLNAQASVQGTFAYSPAAGTVLQPGTQTLTAVFTPSDTQHNSAVTASVQINVLPATPATPVAPTVTWSAPAAITSGTALSSVQLNATANVSGTFVYTPAAGTVLPVGTQTLTATFTPSDTADYSTAKATTQITVKANSVAPTITWHTPAAIAYGTALSSAQLDAVASVPGTLAYTPASGTVLQAGTHTLSVSFTPANTTSYTAASASVKITVAQATPVITWPAPAAIQQGTALSAAQLDATANVPGTFTYLPSAGTVPQAGTLQLSATFSPKDAADYGSVKAQKSLIVTGPPDPPPTGCGGPTIHLNSGMSQSAIKSAITTAPNCSLIVFAAGTYNMSSTMSVPCNANLTLTGPPTTPATAILNATFANGEIFYMSGCSGITLEYLGFANTAGIYVNVPSTGASGITISHSQFFGLPGNATNYLSETGIYFTGYATGGTLSNVNITWNNFGSPTDCEGAMTQQTDQGGYCSGIVFTASLDNITVSNNTFQHLEEGFHVNCTQPGCTPPTSNTWKNFTAENNDFSQIHRIGMEMQPQPSSNIVIQYNSEHDFINGYYSTMGISSACCNNGADSPGTIDSNNVLIANFPAPNAPPNYIPFAIEFWGNGALAQGNLVQGYWANGIAWGYAPNAIISNNTLCGPNMALPDGGYIKNEEHQATPTITNNTITLNCSAIASTAPSLSPAPGTVSGPVTVTLSDTGTNHSIYYTTDGSTPTTSSTLYTGPFSVAAGTTVNAIGMWGRGANAKSYPAGYGYVPSGVVSATYLASAVAKQPTARAAIVNGANLPTVAEGREYGSTAVLTSVAISPPQAVVHIGGTTQLKAVARFSDGSSKDVTGQFTWKSSDTRTITTNAAGLISGLASGKATIYGTYQGLQASLKATSTIGELVWNGPLVITRGGIYTGNWQSSDGHTAAVTVNTQEPVTIENAHIRSRSDLIRAGVAGVNLTIRNSAGVALTPAENNRMNGVFLDVTSPAGLDVENNYLENAGGGVVVHGYAGNRDGKQSIVVFANRVRNINGLLSHGAGPSLAGASAASPRPGSPHFGPAHFIELDDVQSVPGILFGWNEVINDPDHSLAGDNIEIFRSSGTVNQPLEIHDSYLQGADPHGGGIAIKGGLDDTAQNAAAFNNIHDNQIVSTGSHGIAFFAGHDNLAANNRVISSGMLQAGRKNIARSVGMADDDRTGRSIRNGSMYNNTMRDNTIGWMCWEPSCAALGNRMDAHFSASPGDYSTNSVLISQPITRQMEEEEYQIWLNKINAAAVSIGPAFQN